MERTIRFQGPLKISGLNSWWVFLGKSFFDSFCSVLFFGVGNGCFFWFTPLNKEAILDDLLGGWFFNEGILRSKFGRLLATHLKFKIATKRRQFFLERMIPFFQSNHPFSVFIYILFIRQISMWSLPSLKQTVRPLKTWDTSKGKMNSSSFQPSTYRCFHSPVGFQGGSFLSHFDPEFWVIFSGSTIRTLLHRKINPKDWQASSLWWCFGFLLFFRVVSGDYGKPANPVFEPTQNPTNPDPRFQRRVCCIAWDRPKAWWTLWEAIRYCRRCYWPVCH